MREHYLGLVNAGLNSPERIDQADDDTLLKHIGGTSQRLRTLRDAVKQQSGRCGHADARRRAASAY